LSPAHRQPIFQQAPLPAVPAQRSLPRPEMTKLIGAAHSHHEDKGAPLTPTRPPREVPDTDRTERLVTDGGSDNRSPDTLRQVTTWQR
jgi:hypothetical protein